MAETPADGNSGVAEKSTAMITLISSDGKRFDVTKEVAGMSQTIAHMIEDDCVENGVPLPNVDSAMLTKVLEYCNKHVRTTGKSGNNNTSTSEQDSLKSFDADFMKIDMFMLHGILLAAIYLDIRGLLNLSCQTVADVIKGKSPEEIRKTFNITNDFTPEEEEQIRQENAWAFD